MSHVEVPLRTVTRVYRGQKTIIRMEEIKAGYIIKLSGDILAPDGWFRAMSDAYRVGISDESRPFQRAVTLNELVSGHYTWAVSGVRLTEDEEREIGE